MPYEEIPGSRPFGFAIDHHDLVDTLRAQMLTRPGVELRSGEASDRASLLVCDLRRCGSLYARLLDRLVAPDAARQGGPALAHATA